MYETISTANITQEEWLRLRKTGIGGSDAGAICGLNPYSSWSYEEMRKQIKNLRFEMQNWRKRKC